MLTSLNILVTLDKYAAVVIGALTGPQTRQFIDLLAAVAGAERQPAQEDAVDALTDFCCAVPAIRTVLDSIYSVYSGGNRGEHNFDLTETEQLRLYANRLIKATEDDLEKDGKNRAKRQEKSTDEPD